MPAATEVSRGEKVVTGLAMAMLVAAFTTAGFGAFADGHPWSRVQSRETFAHVPAMPVRIGAGPQRSGQLSIRGARCQLTGAVETALDEVH